MSLTSVHVLRFDDERTWDEMRAQRPAGATYWHPGVTSPSNGDGIPVPDLRSWTVLARWDGRGAWGGALDGTGPWQGAAEAWSALLAPGPTRYLPAPAQWAEGQVLPPFGEPQARLPEGEVAVVTTVGLAPDDIPNALRFVADVERVVATLADAAGNRGFRQGNAEHFPTQVDPFTFSLWSDVRAAHAWAYGAGVHATALEAHMGGPHILRGSFTVFSVVETRGTWSDRQVLRPAERIG